MRAINFSVGGPKINVDLFSVVVCMEMYRGPEADPLVEKLGGKAPLSWNTFSNESRKFACFLIFGEAKKSQISVLSRKNDV